MSGKRTFRIVVGVDLSDRSHIVLETAFDLAGRHTAPELHLIAVLEPPRQRKHVDLADELAELDHELRVLALDKLSDFHRAVDGPDSWDVLIHARAGKPADAIVDLAWEAQADLIIIGRHSGKEPRFSRLGSVPAQVLQLTRCPVQVVQPTDYGMAEDLDEQRARQCPACVAVRSDSQGERWFCEEHSGYRLSRRVIMAHHSGSWPIGGGPLL
jgi:nucleotide-binding universal stress UspA family protein